MGSDADKTRRIRLHLFIESETDKIVLLPEDERAEQRFELTKVDCVKVELENLSSASFEDLKTCKSKSKSNDIQRYSEEIEVDVKAGYKGKKFTIKSIEMMDCDNGNHKLPVKKNQKLTLGQEKSLLILKFINNQKSSDYKCFFQPIYSVRLKFNSDNGEKVSIQKPEIPLDMIKKAGNLIPLDDTFSLAKAAKFYRKDTGCDVVTANLPSLKMADKASNSEFSLTVGAAEDDNAAVRISMKPKSVTNAPSKKTKESSKDTNEVPVHCLELEFRVSCSCAEVCQKVQLFDGEQIINLKTSENHHIGTVTLTQVRRQNMKLVPFLNNEEKSFAKLDFQLKLITEDKKSAPESKKLCLDNLDARQFEKEEFPEIVVVRVILEPFETVVLVPKGLVLRFDLLVASENSARVQLFDGEQSLELKRSDSYEYLTGTATLQVLRLRQENKLVPFLKSEEKSFQQLDFHLKIAENKEPLSLDLSYLDNKEFEKEEYPGKVVVRVSIEPFKTVVLVPKSLVLGFELQAERATDAMIVSNIGEFSLKCAEQPKVQGLSTLSHLCQINVFANENRLEFESGCNFKVQKCRQGNEEFPGHSFSDLSATADCVTITGRLEQLAETLEIKTLNKCNLIDLIVCSADCEEKFNETLHVTGNCKALGNNRCTQANQLMWSGEYGKSVKCFTASLLAKSMEKDCKRQMYPMPRDLTNGSAGDAQEDLYFALTKSENSSGRNVKLKNIEQHRWRLSDCIDSKSKDEKSRDEKSKDEKSKDEKSKDEKSKDEKSKTPTDGLNVKLCIRIEDCPVDTTVDSIFMSCNSEELKNGLPLARVNSSNVFAGSLKIRSQQGEPLKFSLSTDRSNLEGSTLQTQNSKEEWTIPPINSFRNDTGNNFTFLVSMKWEEEPIVLQIVDVTLRVAVFCEIDFIHQIIIETNFEAQSQSNKIGLKRLEQVKKPTKYDPTGLEKWSCECKFEACSNGENFLNFDCDQLSFSVLSLTRKIGKKFTVFAYCKTIKLQSNQERREIHYEVTVDSGYKNIDFRPGVYVTLQLAYGPCSIRILPKYPKLSGKILLRSMESNEMELKRIRQGGTAKEKILDQLQYSYVCTCKEDNNEKKGECKGNETVRAKRKHEACILMFKHGRQLLLPDKRQLFVKFELPDSVAQMLREESQQPTASDKPELQIADPSMGELTHIELKCGPASGNLEYYCQLTSSQTEGPSVAICKSPIKVQLKFITKLKTDETIKRVLLLKPDNSPMNRIELLKKNDSEAEEASKKKANIDIWVKKVTLKMVQIHEELFLTGMQKLCIKREFRSEVKNKDKKTDTENKKSEGKSDTESESESKEKREKQEAKRKSDMEQFQEIQLLTHQPGECLQFNIEIFEGNVHRVFPNMPMNQLPKDSILRYFQTALYSALPQLSAKPKFAEVRDVYAKRLVPLIKQNGDYDEADGASRPHEFHDIWGEDPESELEEVDQEAIMEPKSAVRYVEQKKRRNLESSRDFTREIHRRLNKKYHTRERVVWSHLSVAAANCPACKAIYKEYEYQGSNLCKDWKKLMHDEYISVLTRIASSIISSECTCKHDHKLIMSNSAAVVRGRLEAFLVDNTSNMLSDLFYDEWRRHTEASGSWFVLLLAVWDKFNCRTQMGFEDAIRESDRPVPAFFKWRLIDLS